ncbi:hypothetical protein C8Q76DRAFT_698726 [Earliella scabrosa]|nr:hypothetical protein C8Q76DRAFT_698726 [Earliella scabrosa]
MDPPPPSHQAKRPQRPVYSAGFNPRRDHRAEVYGKWTGRSVAADYYTELQLTTFHYDSPICPSRPLRLGLMVRVLMLSNAAHRPPKPDSAVMGWKYDVYDQGIEGHVDRFLHVCDEMVVLLVKNHNKKSPIAYAQVTLPHVPNITVHADCNTARAWYTPWTKQAQSGGAREAFWLDLRAGISSRTCETGRRRWEWVESAESDSENDYAEECGGDDDVGHDDGESGRTDDADDEAKSGDGEEREDKGDERDDVGERRRNESGGGGETESDHRAGAATVRPKANGGEGAEERSERERRWAQAADPTLTCGRTDHLDEGLEERRDHHEGREGEGHEHHEESEDWEERARGKKRRRTQSGHASMRPARW